MTSMKSKDNSTKDLVTMHHPICDTVVCTLTDRMLQTKQKIIIYQINKVLIQSVSSIVILKVSYYGTNYWCLNKKKCIPVVFLSDFAPPFNTVQRKTLTVEWRALWSSLFFFGASLSWIYLIITLYAFKHCYREYASVYNDHTIAAF